MNVRFAALQTFLFIFACTLFCIGSVSLFHYLAQDAAQFHTIQVLPDSGLSLILFGGMLVAGLVQRRGLMRISGILALALSLYTAGHNLLAGGADQGVSLITGFNRSRTSWAVLSALFVIAMMFGGLPKFRQWARLAGIALVSFGLLQGGYALFDPDSSMLIGFKISTEMLACFVIILMGAAMYIQSLIPSGRALRLDSATLALGIFSAVVAVGSWYGVSRYQEQVVLHSSQASLNSAEKSLQRVILSRLHLIQRMGERWEAAGGLPGARIWEQETSSYLRDHPNLEFIALLDAGQSWLRFKGRDERSEPLARTLLHDDLSRYTSSRDSLQPDLPTSSVMLGQQLGVYTILIMPLQGVAQDLPYLIAGVDLQATLDELLLGNAYNIVLRITRNGQQLYGPTADALGDFFQVGARSLMLGNGEQWQVHSFIKRHVRAVDSSHLATVMMACMLLFGFLLMVSQRLGAIARERNRELLERNQFFSLSSEMLCMINLPGNFVQVNPAFVSVLGYTTEELIGSPYMELIFPEDRAAAKDAIHRLLQGEIVSALDLRAYHAEGRTVWLELSAAVGADGLIYVVARDVTRQRQYESTLAQHQMLFQIAGQIARVGGWVFDLESDELLLSDEVCALHGIAAGTVLQLEDVFRLYLPEYHEVMRQSMEDCIKEGRPYELKVQGVDALGNGMWVRLSGRPAVNSDGRTTHVQGALQDITPEIEAAENLEAMAERMRKILQSITDGFYALDNQWRFTYANPQAEILLSTTAEDMYGRKVWELFPETGGTVLYQQFHEVLETGETRHFEYFYPPVQRWFEVSVYPGEGGLAVFFRDISERKHHEQQLKRMVGELAHNVSHDALTGLPNRHIFEDRLRQSRELCLRHGRQMAVLFIDLDDFKPINDSLGHETGDLVLQQVAHRLETSIRPGDSVARVGGDEFIVLLPDLAQEDEVLMVADRIMGEIAKPLDMEDVRLQITASIGITLADGRIEDPVQLIRQADLAMYKAKQLGRNHYQWFTEDMDQRILERLQLRADLQRAVENREFELYYQPQIAARTGQLCGMEALLRWRHPERGMVPPDQFIPLAESSGQIVALSEWVMATACRDACRLKAQGIGGYTVAVNVSPLHFQRAGFLAFVQRVLADSGMDPSLLELEVTEGLLLNNTDQAIATLATLQQIGLKIAIDDFGTGFSSLGYLKRLPIDKIKIDKSFIDDVISDTRDAAIVQSIIGMAHNLGLAVIAEGVETPAQQAFLHQHGCDLIQGYLHARPMPFDEFAAWAKQRKL